MPPQWPNDFLLQFIDEYRKLETLWKIKSPFYYNKQKRELCYTLLKNKLQEVDPEATEETVKTKINNLRCSFMKEYKKVHGSNYTIQSKLWYYDKLLFLKYQEDEIKGEEDEDSNISSNVFLPEPVEYTFEMASEDDSQCNQDHFIGDEQDEATQFLKFNSTVPRKRKRDNSDASTSSKTEDIIIFTDYIASSFRNLHYESSKKKLRMLIQKSIMQVEEEDEKVYQAQLDKSAVENLIKSENLDSM